MLTALDFGQWYWFRLEPLQTKVTNMHIARSYHACAFSTTRNAWQTHRVITQHKRACKL